MYGWVGWVGGWVGGWDLFEQVCVCVYVWVGGWVGVGGWVRERERERRERERSPASRPSPAGSCTAHPALACAPAARAALPRSLRRTAPASDRPPPHVTATPPPPTVHPTRLSTVHPTRAPAHHGTPTPHIVSPPSPTPATVAPLVLARRPGQGRGRRGGRAACLEIFRRNVRSAPGATRGGIKARIRRPVRRERGAPQHRALAMATARRSARGGRERERGRGGGTCQRAETCPISTEGWTRRVHFVREGGGGGGGGLAGAGWSRAPRASGLERAAGGTAVRRGRGGGWQSGRGACAAVQGSEPSTPPAEVGRRRSARAMRSRTCACRRGGGCDQGGPRGRGERRRVG